MSIPTSSTPVGGRTEPYPKAAVAGDRPTQPAPGLFAGQPVHVNLYATWQAATVTSVTGTRVGVDFTVPGRLRGPVPVWVVRPAYGIRLCPAAGLQPGDQVVAFDGSVHTVEYVWQTPDRWWVIGYTGGGHGTVPAGSVLRLVDTVTGCATASVPAGDRTQRGDGR